MKWIYLSISLFSSFAYPSPNSDFKRVLECQRTMVSTVKDLYRPDNGYFLCDEPASHCFLVYNSGETWSLKIPSKSTYAINEINIDLADIRERYDHHLTTWTDPNSNQSVLVDIFWRTNRRAFAKVALEGNPAKFENVALAKAELSEALAIANKSIMTTVNLIQSGIDQRVFPPGWDIPKVKRLQTERLAGCSGFKEVEALRHSLEILK